MTETTEGRWVPSEPTEEMMQAALNGGRFVSRAAEYKAMLAAAPSPWQPIETFTDELKKTQGAILLCDARVSDGCFVAEWDDEPLKPGWNWALDDLDYHKDLPTHWMPLPPQPPLPRETNK